MEQDKQEKHKPFDNTKIVVTVKAWHMVAFGLRMQGLTYKAIAQRVGYSEDRIKVLFSKQGSLFQTWQIYRKEKLAEIFEEVTEILYGNLPDTARALVLEARKAGMDGNVARKIHLDFTLGRLGLQPERATASTLHELAKLADERDTSKKTVALLEGGTLTDVS